MPKFRSADELNYLLDVNMEGLLIRYFWGMFDRKGHQDGLNWCYEDDNFAGCNRLLNLSGMKHDRDGNVLTMEFIIVDDDGDHVGKEHYTISVKKVVC